MKVKVMYAVSIPVVFALAAIGFSMAPGSVSGAGDSRSSERSPGVEQRVASPTDTNTTDTGTEGTENTYYGDGAGNGNTGRWETFIGAEAGASNNSGESNTFVGQHAGMYNTSGASNTFVGRTAGYRNTTGNYNTFMGRAAGYANTTGYQNTFVGYFAGYSTTTIGGNPGRSNTCIGSEAGYNNTTGDFNIFIGSHAGYENKEGHFNTFVGHNAGGNTTTIEGNSGKSNTFIGGNAGGQNTTGDNNTIIGYYAGFWNLTGSNNIFIGSTAGEDELGSNKLYIESSDTPNPLIWGDFEAGSRRVVIYGGFRAIASYISSDRRWKKNIKPLASSLDKISGLQGVSYEWNREDYPDVGMMKGKQIGLVAQDVEQVLPELVSEDKDGYKAVSYSKLTAVLVEAVKELKAENDRQRLENQRQQAEIEELRSIIKDLRS